VSQLDALTGEHLRAARNLLRWSAETLAARSRVDPSVVKRAETYEGPVPKTARIDAIRGALEAAGIEFTSESSNGLGIRMRKAGGD
jgi:ribosome-binding protein aMBF1 (putative translation factor)